MLDDNLSVTALAAIAEQDPAQLQHHANKIRELDIAGDECIHQRLFKDVTFPVLERVAIDSWDGNEDRLLEPYLQSNLKSFRFFGGPITDGFLQKLQVGIMSSHLPRFSRLNYSREQARNWRKS